MISGEDIAIGKARLIKTDNVPDILTEDDVDSLISVFRILCGPLEVKYKYEFENDLKAVRDYGNSRNKAAKLAGTLARINDEDFGVDLLQSKLLSDDNEQRRIFSLFAFSLLYTIPAELTSLDAFNNYMRQYTIKTTHNFTRRRVA